MQKRPTSVTFGDSSYDSLRAGLRPVACLHAAAAAVPRDAFLGDHDRPCRTQTVVHLWGLPAIPRVDSLTFFTGIV